MSVRHILGFLFFALCSPLHAEWQLALPGWQYEFPKDHGIHPEFKTEWWYFTGNLTAKDGREFGYQVTFFRQGVNSRDELIPLSRFVVHDLKFAHFALSDLSGRRFVFQQKLSRGTYQEAGFSQGTRLAWIEDWSCEMSSGGVFHLRGNTSDDAIDLSLTSLKAPAIHGQDGISQKASGEGRASHYYSLTRLQTAGRVKLGNDEFSVTGTSWFDHEWATNQLSKDQVGWDWFSLQFEDGSEAMLFQLCLKEGGRDIHSGGTFVNAQGQITAIGNDDFSLEPVRWWVSPATKARYPLEWNLTVPKLGIAVRIHAAMDNQELLLSPVSYWEGAIRVDGQLGNAAVRGKGYLEMTGYAGAMVGLQAGKH